MPPTVKTENKFGYDWVLLNNRWYIVQNHSPTKLADGTDIPIVTNATTWIGLTTPARCVYNNSTDTEFIAKYGYLYNWYAVEAGMEMPCAGCTVPSNAEWAALRDWLIAEGFNWDGTTTGNKIGKAVASSSGEWAASATVGHVGNDQGSNNSAGLAMLPGGTRSGSNGSFLFAPNSGYVWGSDEISENTSQVWLTYRWAENLDILPRDQKFGSSIRISRPFIPRRARGLEYKTISKIGF